MILLLWSCVRGNAPGQPAVDPLAGGPPRITDVDWACDVDEAQWTLAIQADAWTGGGRLWIARDAETVESHAVRSVSAPADGSADTLELELAVAADWRDAVSGSSTRFRCGSGSGTSACDWRISTPMLSWRATTTSRVIG